ncbi:MAG: M48 family metallopeptidase [Myxococcales bacterium]|nr:M48 family metallopeptidase [Myxococcales bacterium]
MEAKPRLPDDRVNLPSSHPLADAGQLIAFVVALGLLLFAAVAYSVELVVWLLPHDTEVRLAHELWPAEEPTADDAERHEKLQALVEALASGWPDNPYRLQVRIAREEQPNAFALPGGLVLVTEGLLDSAESENELAFVLGHEIGHFRGRDHLRGLGQGLLFQLVLASIGVGGGDIRLLGDTGLIAGLSFSRDQERAADRFGLELLQHHYGHAAGAGIFFERVASSDPVHTSMPTFISTHPDPRERAAEIRKLAAQRGYRLQGRLRPPL